MSLHYGSGGANAKGFAIFKRITIIYVLVEDTFGGYLQGWLAAELRFHCSNAEFYL